MLDFFLMELSFGECSLSFIERAGPGLAMLDALGVNSSLFVSAARKPLSLIGFGAGIETEVASRGLGGLIIMVLMFFELNFCGPWSAVVFGETETTAGREMGIRMATGVAISIGE